jgi:hypothetical protein
MESLTNDAYRFDGRTIRVDKASERAPRNNGGFQGRGGYNQSEGGSGGMFSHQSVQRINSLTNLTGGQRYGGQGGYGGGQGGYGGGQGYGGGSE